MDKLVMETIIYLRLV